MAVFDVTAERSFQDLTVHWLPMLQENCKEPIEFALIANKTDLINERVITESEALDVLDNDPNLLLKDEKSPIKQGIQSSENKYRIDNLSMILSKQYFEVSAKDPDGVDKVFKQFL